MAAAASTSPFMYSGGRYGNMINHYSFMPTEHDFASNYSTSQPQKRIQQNKRSGSFDDDYTNDGGVEVGGLDDTDHRSKRAKQYAFDDTNVSEYAAIERVFNVGKRLHGPPGARRLKYDKRGKIIFAHHRTSPIPYQVSVAIQASFIRPETLYTNREKDIAGLNEEDLLAPLGTVDCMHSKKGELVYTLIGKDGAPRREVKTRDCWPEVFCSVNGLRKTVRLAFAGYAAFNQDIGHPDSGGTIVVSGTCAPINTGPLEILCGQTVYFSKYPYVVKDSSTQKIEPGIRNVGYPGQSGEKTMNGTSLAKFVPAVYGLKDQDTASWIANIKGQIDAEMRQVFHSSDVYGKDPKSLMADLVNTWKKIERECLNDCAPDLPIINIARTYLWKVAFMRFEGKDGREETQMALGKKLYSILQHDFNELREYSCEFRDAINVSSIIYEHRCLEDGVETAVGDKDNYDLNKQSGGDGFYDGMRLGLNLILWAEDMSAIQQDWLRDHLRHTCIGTCLRDAPPGHTLDLNLGHFFNN